MRYSSLIVRSTLFSAVLLWPVLGMADETAVGGQPSQYRPLSEAVLKPIDGQSGPVKPEQMDAITEAVHPVQLSRTPSQTAKKSITPAAKTQVVSVSSAPSVCPSGWTPQTLGSVINCEQDCYNAFDKSWVVTNYQLNTDGTPVLNGGSGAPIYGAVEQQVYGDDGHCNIFHNEYLATADDLKAEIKEYANDGLIYTYQATTADPKAGFQLQYYSPRDKRPAGSCAPQTYLKQSSSCPS